MKGKLSLITLTLMLGVGILFFLLPSCDKVKEATQIKVKYDLPDRYFTIDSISHLKSEQVLFSESFDANIDSITGANNGLLSNVSFYQLRLTVVSPDWVTLNWLNSARITILPEGGAPIEVAKTVSINSTARTVDFEISDLAGASGINGPFLLTVYGDMSGPVPAESLQMLLESGIQVTINPL